MSVPKILVIDDMPANLMALAGALADEYDLQLATSGLQGLALAEVSPPDLILLDVMMPEIDGYEVCRRIKASETLRQIPVVFVTALTDLDSEAEGLRLGAADYLTKPINVSIARQRIHNLLEREQLRKAVEAERNLLEQRVAERTAELEAVAGVRERALAAAERLSALKTEFIDNMSHELRTPLNHLLGFAFFCERAKDLEAAKSGAQKIRSAGEKLLAIVTSVLDFSALESGKLAVSRESFEISPLLDELAEKHSEKARAKNLGFEMCKLPGLPVSMVGDRYRVWQVLDEVLGNAVKYTESGSVTFEVRPAGERIEFVVSDSGVGLTSEQLESGFKPFQQGDGSSTRRFGGLGLGLALADHLLRLMGGSLVAENKSGGGARFCITLPVGTVVPGNGY